MGEKRIHLVGIGGISMSGIAKILLNRGYQVSGSDVKDSSLLDSLREKGADITIGHAAENVAGAHKVVYSSAIPEDNIELKFARGKELKIYERAQMVAELMEGYKGIAVSGTHGKTTTTSMIAFILKKAGLDPAVLLGGKMDILNGNACDGQGEYFVIEADESDGSLLHYNPDVAVVTNLELDHHDYYSSKQKLNKTFKYFLQKIPREGRIIVYSADQNLGNLVSENDARVLSYGLNEGNLQAENVNLMPFGSFYTVNYKGRKLGEINLQVPGKHNILNSLAAFAVCMYVGLSFTEIKKFFDEYQGVKRRFEKKGLMNDILVVDDYAHHPTEIRETLTTARNTGYERLITVFQPHRYSRTKHLMEELSYSFTSVDKLIITDIYAAGEDAISGVNAKKLVALTKENSEVEVEYIPDFADIKSYLMEILQPRDIVLTLGAGNVYEVGEDLLSDI
ncbi:MAG: UDP-N-acetylmuramate--L-alanine ligase [Bacillota bacterium]